MTGNAVAAANTAAQRLHARLGTDYDRPIDIFRVVQDEGIWLASKPLSGRLFGFYLRHGDAAGIVVNHDHPEALQRYTCAHELGHHVLGHQSHLDESEDVQGPTAASRTGEIAAQAFAGAFLMPLQAVNRVLRRLGITKNRRLYATDVYAVSRELDVSYSAAAWQLAALGRIATPDADRWAKQGAAAAKNAMRPGPPPEGDNRAALYIVDGAARDVPILCRPGDELRLRLPENASTGHVWRLVSAPSLQSAAQGPSWDGDQAAERLTTLGSPSTPAPAVAGSGSALRLAQDNYLPATASPARYGGPEEDATIGRAGTREFVFVAQHPGRIALDLKLARPWESHEVDDFTTAVRIGPAHLLDGFARDQAQAHAARVAGS